MNIITVTVHEFTPEQRAEAYQRVAELLQRTREKRRNGEGKGKR